MWEWAYVILFVGSLYIWPGATQHNRNDRSVIRRRMASAALASLLSMLLTAFLLLLHSHPNRTPESIGKALGMSNGSLLPLVYTLLHLTLLYAGPLYVRGAHPIVDISFSFWGSSGVPLDLEPWRDYVVGPVAEELVFRACVLTALDVSGAPYPHLQSALAFAVAHAHFVLEHLRGYPIRQACLAVLFQMGYTFLFGMYTAGVFAATRSLYAATLAHMWCNVCGLPDLDALLALRTHAPRQFRCGAALYVLGLGGFVLTWIRYLS
jgi:prenyl protein peptidase